MQSLLDSLPLNGHKTYLAAAAAVVYAAYGWFTGSVDAGSAAELVAIGGAALGLGHKSAKAEAAAKRVERAIRGYRD